MNTATAALEAHVTVATIRHWCRAGVVKAAKTAGQWIIDAASLARRITLSKPAVKTVVFTAETMVAIGGSRWTKNDMDRVYINNWARFIGLEVSTYNTGNISSATLDGERISNSEAGRLLGMVEKVYFDVTDGSVHVKWGWGEARSMDRDDVKYAITIGIRNEIAAL